MCDTELSYHAPQRGPLSIVSKGLATPVMGLTIMIGSFVVGMIMTGIAAINLHEVSTNNVSNVNGTNVSNPTKAGVGWVILLWAGGAIALLGIFGGLFIGIIRGYRAEHGHRGYDPMTGRSYYVKGKQLTLFNELLLIAGIIVLSLAMIGLMIYSGIQRVEAVKAGDQGDEVTFWSIVLMGGIIGLILVAGGGVVWLYFLHEAQRTPASQEMENFAQTAAPLAPLLLA